MNTELVQLVQLKRTGLVLQDSWDKLTHAQ